MSSYRKDYYERNKDKFNKRSSEYYSKNKDKLLAEAKKKRENKTDEEKEDEKIARRQRYLDNREYHQKYSKKKWEEYKQLKAESENKSAAYATLADLEDEEEQEF